MSTRRAIIPHLGKPKKTIKVKFATYVQDLGDGSSAVRFFPTMKEAERFFKKDEDKGYTCCNPENLNTYELEFDMNGNLLTKEND
jgi:hypothetical protein